MSDDQGQGNAFVRALSGLTTPTFFYLLAFVMTTGLTLSLFNPYWGSAAMAWPHQVLAFEGGFHWGPTQALAGTLVLAVLCFVIALLWRPGRMRAAIALLGCGFGMIAFRPMPEILNYWILPIACALVGGALLVPRDMAARRRLTFLLVAFALLASCLWLPWTQERASRAHQVDPGYHSTATAQLDLLSNPPEEFMVRVGAGDERTETPVAGYLQVLLQTLPQTSALLLFVLACATLLGLGRGWVRWAAAFVLLLLAFGPAWALWDHGSVMIGQEALDGWEKGLRYWGDTWRNHACLWVLPLAAATAELARRRDL